MVTICITLLAEMGWLKQTGTLFTKFCKFQQISHFQKGMCNENTARKFEFCQRFRFLDFMNFYE